MFRSLWTSLFCAHFLYSCSCVFCVSSVSCDLICKTTTRSILTVFRYCCFWCRYHGRVLRQHLCPLLLQRRSPYLHRTEQCRGGWNEKHLARLERPWNVPRQFSRGQFRHDLPGTQQRARKKFVVGRFNVAKFCVLGNAGESKPKRWGGWR